MHAAARAASLKARARQRDIPTIYVNDNYGRWNLGFREICEEVRRTTGRPFKADTRPSTAIDLDRHGSCFDSSA